LIEVLVAVAIVAVTLGAGLRAAGTLTDNAARLSDVIAAQWCADNQLTNLRLSRQLPGIGDAEVNLVWEPAWSPANMTDEARLELGML
jgi:general secretion pathway protein I